MIPGRFLARGQTVTSRTEAPSVRSRCLRSFVSDVTRATALPLARAAAIMATDASTMSAVPACPHRSPVARASGPSSGISSQCASACARSAWRLPVGPRLRDQDRRYRDLGGVVGCVAQHRPDRAVVAIQRDQRAGIEHERGHPSTSARAAASSSPLKAPFSCQAFSSIAGRGARRRHRRRSCRWPCGSLRRSGACGCRRRVSDYTL